VIDLIALEEIRRLKHRYLRSVDSKHWDELAATLTPDATAHYDSAEPVRLTGRDELVGFLRRQLGPAVITTHSVGQPEIDIDGAAATGTWAMRDTLIMTKYQLVLQGAGFYEDRYARGEDGAWRISHTSTVRTYEAMVPLASVPSFRLTSPADPTSRTKPVRNAP
jgi:hypothetical protein